MSIRTASLRWMLSVAALATLASAHASPARAHTDQWEWYVAGVGTPFDSFEEAADHVRSWGGPHALFTMSKRKRTATSPVPDEAWEHWELSAPPTTFNVGDWVYTTHSQTFASEPAAAAGLLAAWEASNHPCAVWTEASGGWNVVTTYFGGPSTRENRTYLVWWETYAANPTPHCIAPNPPGPGYSDGIQRDRTVSCPTHYSLSGGQCVIGWAVAIKGRPLMPCGPGAACSEVGNPADTATGNEFQTEVDFTGVGLEFSRTYNSMAPDEAPGLGRGWTHSYAHSLIASSNAYGIIRGGRLQTLKFLSSTHYIATADGIQITKVGSDWLANLSDGTIEVYDANGRLTQVKERGHVTTLTYTNGNLTSIAGPFGHTLQLQYEDGRVKRLIDPAGNEIEYTYDANSNLTQVEYPDTTTRTYHYEDTSFPNHLTGITDESGTRYATYDYDSMGRVILTEHAGGADEYTLSYGSTSTTVTDPLGTNNTYQFTNDAYSRRVVSRNIGGNTRSAVLPLYSTDYQRRVTQRIDERGIVTTFSYDQNHLTSKTEASGTPRARTTSYAYLNTDSDLPTLITESDRTTAFTYDSNGGMLTKTITDLATSATRTWTWTRDSHGRVLTEDGPRADVSDVTTYTYYSCTTGYQCGQLNTVTNALSQTTPYNTYNAHGQPLTITDPNGVVTTLTYDARQRVTSRSASGETTTLEYWPTGLLKKVTLPDTSFMLYTYDAAHRLWKVEDGEGNRIEYTLDAMGNRTAENAYDPSSALVRTHTRVFNTLNQLWKDVNAAGTAAVTTVFGYDANGNQTSIAAPLSRTTGQLYDELNRLKQITDPASGVTQFAYDRFDQRTQVTDPRSLATTYTYNNLGDLTQLVSPDTGTTTSTYDSGGNLATRTDARSKTGTYAYDALNRVTSITYPDQTLSFTYDAGTYGKGHLTGASDANHSLTFTHDALGRVTAKSQTVGAVTKSVSYGYTDGNLTSLVTPSGQTIAYDYADGRIASVTLNSATTILNQVLHDPFGPVSGWTWGNSTIAARTYDEDGKIEALDSAGAATYGYDDAFRITGITDLDESSRSWTYGYDLLDRLTSGSKTGQTIGYTYDANGNRLSETGTQTATYTVSGSSNRVSSITGTPARTYSYDAAGNTTGYDGFTFAYADSGRMKSVTDGSGTTTYSLNTLGQRVKKAGPAGTRLFVYDEAGHLIGEYDSSGALIQETVWMGDIPVATLRPNGSGGVNHFYVHSDHLNTPRRVSRPSDNVVLWRWDSDPFGSMAANEDPDGDSTAFAYNLRFPGQYHDAESGLSYNYFRDYDAVVGRYVESDPIGLRSGINTYAYVLNNPSLFIDPLGLAESDVNAIRDHIEGHFPEIDQQSGWEFGTPDPGARGGTDPWTGRIVVDDKYAKQCLTKDEFLDLYFQLLHESMHSTDHWLQRVWDALRGTNLTNNHAAIYRRVAYEEQGTPYDDMWGVPKGRSPKPLVFPEAENLFEKTRPCECEK